LLAKTVGAAPHAVAIDAAIDPHIDDAPSEIIRVRAIIVRKIKLVQRPIKVGDMKTVSSYRLTKWYQLTRDLNE
jgi:hypothetical protein